MEITNSGYFANERVFYPCTVVRHLTTYNYEAGRPETFVLVLVDGELNTDDIYRSFAFANIKQFDSLEFVINKMSIEMTESRPRFMVEATSVRNHKLALFNVVTQKTPERTNTYDSKPHSENFKQHLKHIVGDDDDNEPYRHSEADLALAKRKLERHEARQAREAKRRQERRFRVGDKVRLNEWGIYVLSAQSELISERKLIASNKFVITRIARNIRMNEEPSSVLVHINPKAFWGLGNGFVVNLNHIEFSHDS